jgi:multicomponent Na+:H+ antiporter subunit D
MEPILLLTPILAPLLAALLLPLVDRISKNLRPWFCVLAAALALAGLLRLAPAVLAGETLVYWMGGWQPREGLAIGISLAIDGWSWFVAFIVALVGLLSLVFSSAYMRRETGQGSYYVLFMLLLAALIGFVFSGDLFNQFVWLEVFSVAAFALTGFHFNDRTSVEAAFKYLITNSIAALFIAIALSLLYMQTGALNLAHISTAFQPTPAGIVALGLLIAGYGVKAALVPWHFWLPDAHTAAPGPVSAVFSGALIKVGIYAVARNLFMLAPENLFLAIRMPLLILGAAGILIGGIQMIQQDLIKRILAYSSVAQMGYILVGLAIGTPLALGAAAMHILHHALAKSALFMGAGVLTWRADVHRLRESPALARRMPVTFAVFALAGLSLSGMPLFSGFISKTMLEEAALEAHLGWVATTAILGSLLTFTGIARLLWSVFLSEMKQGAPQPKEGALAKPAVKRAVARRRIFFPPLPAEQVSEAPLMALLPMAALVTGSLMVGLAPESISGRMVWSAAHALAEPEAYQAQALGLSTDDLPAVPVEEEEHLPGPFDLRAWLPPLLVASGGSLLAYWLVSGRSPVRGAWSAPLRWLLAALRGWHSGVVSDYALWTAFGTALMLVAILLNSRLQ